MANIVQQVDALIAYIDSLDSGDKVQEQREVLPSSVRPTHYYVALTPDLVKNYTFQGRVDIDLKISKKVNEIVLNAIEITFFSAKLTQNNKSQEINGKDIKIDDKTEFATIPLKEEAEIGNATLSITFEGILNDKMKGFYKSKYKRSNGEEAYCGCTQFEAIDARRAFPCWDEPAVKATFTVELTVPKDLICLSNMPESDAKINGNMRTIVFEKSPIMSTYLLAWIIGEFEYVESKTSRDILVRVWTTMGNKHKAEFACQVGCNCLDFYEKYFGIEYPLPKCDMIAIPDFASGAMENWGLITYREIALLCDKDKASIRAKQYVAIVVCHELAHQWFGNLVTMEWWSQLWLNEGFACFMEYLSSDDLFPNWQMWNMFITSEYSRAFELDGMSNSHSIEVEIKSAKQADEVFDAISYCKGACIIRMLQSYIGNDNFREGLSKYLNNFRYSNAITKDLWDFLGKQSNKPIANIMQNWTKEQGFPLIIASRKGNKLTLKQTRYLSTGKSNDDQDKTVWNIPIRARVEGTNEILTLLFDSQQKSFDIPNEKAKWIHLNADSAGFYCVQYDQDMMKNLILELSNKNTNINVIERVCLIRDARALAEQGVENATVNLLKLINTMKYETSYPVWEAVISSISIIKTLIDTDNKTKSNLNKIMRNLLSEIRLLGWENKDNNNNNDNDEKNNHNNHQKQMHYAENELLRPLIIGALATYEDNDIIKESLIRFRKYIKDPKSNEHELPAFIRDPVFRTALREGDQDEFNSLKNYYLNCDDPADKSTSLRALGATKNQKLLLELLNWVLTSNQVRPQDKVFPFRNVSNNLHGREIAWQFLQKTWDQWFKLFDGGFLVQHLAKIPNSFVTFDKAAEVEQFFKTIDAPVCERSIKQCIEEINKNAAWRERELKNITKWIEENCD